MLEVKANQIQSLNNSGCSLFLESTAYTVSSEMDGVRLMRLNMLDVLQKELTELKANYENKEKEKHMLEENIRKIQTNHQEEIKKIEGKFERQIEIIREECEEKIRSCSAPTTPTVSTTTTTVSTTTTTTTPTVSTPTNIPQTNAIKGR